ncbi:MAG: carbohydrate-binding protein, partial [Firmicutes bacterium]|nr:carbohydrate-binding protein [Bacillota bacterium]
KYLVNYERVTENKNNGSFLWAKDAELSDGIVIDEYGYAAFSGDGQYIRFKDVDFGEASNVMSLVFAGDMYNTCDKVEIIIGDFDSGKRYTNLLNVTSPYIHQNNTLEAAIAVTAGISDVYIRVADYRSLKIVGLTLKSRNIDNSMAAKVYGGTFDSYTRTLTDQYVPARHFGLAGDVINPTVNNTWPGTVLEYKQIMLSEDSDTLEVAIASGGIYAGQPVEIRIGAPDGKLIAKYYVNSHSFTDYTPNKITLDEILEAGMYDFYLVFPLEPRIGNNKSSNVYYFGFKKIN